MRNATDFAREVLWTAFVFGAPLMIFWILVIHIVPLFLHIIGSSWLGILPHLFMTVAYMLTTAVVQVRPHLFATGGWPVMCALLVPASTLALVAALATSALPLLVLGTLIYAVGTCWIGLYAAISLFNIRKGACLLGLALSYPLVRLMTMLIGCLDAFAALALAFIVPLIIFIICNKAARGVLSAYSTSTSLEDLRLTNPSSFLPFTSKFFLCIFLFSLAAGTIMNGVANYSLHPSTIIIWCFALGVVVFFVARRTTPSPNTIFLIASLFAVFALLLALGFPKAGLALSHESAQCGLSACEILLCCYALYSLGARNKLAILPALAWGRAAMDLGLTLGTALQMGGQVFPGAHSHWATLILLAVTFGFVSYNLIAMRSFDFDELADNIKPIANMAQTLYEKSGQTTTEALNHVLSSQYHLTPREIEIFNLLAQGRNTNYIEKNLVIARNTVKTHIRSIYAKIEVHSQQELIDLANSIRPHAPETSIS